MSDSKFHITPAGARNLRAELQHLWRIERPEVTRTVAAAAALGDRSENADYIYGKKRLREIDRRIRYLTKRVDNLTIVDQQPNDPDKIYFGAWVKVEDENGTSSVLRIVGVDEFDAGKGWISLNSPMAKSLLGKTRGDTAQVNRPTGNIKVHILDISYDPNGIST